MYKTDDGFNICMDSLDVIFDNYGITSLFNNFKDGTQIVSPKNVFDDWYIYSVTKSGKTSYGLMKLREAEYNVLKDNKKDYLYDQDISSTAIPFYSFDLNFIDNAKKNSSISTLYKEIDDYTSTNGRYYDFDETICSYFANPNSKANYLIAELYVKKVLEFECKDKKYLPIYNLGYKQILSLQNLSIYERVSMPNEKTDKRINLSSNKYEDLSWTERNAILLARTANPSYYSFAAENIFHATATLASYIIMEKSVSDFNDYVNSINSYDTMTLIYSIIRKVEVDAKIITFSQLYKHAIVSNTGTDSATGGDPNFDILIDDLYISDKSILVSNQKSIFGSKYQ